MEHPSVGFTSATMTIGAGSAPYMPPEGLVSDRGTKQRHYDGRAWDIYRWVFRIGCSTSNMLTKELFTYMLHPLSFLPPSLAMLYTQMWTLRSGGQLYPGLGTFQIAVAVSKGARPTLSKDPSIIPPLLRAMLVGMWDSEPHKRPSAEEVLAVLRDPELAVQVAGFRSRQ